MCVSIRVAQRMIKEKSVLINLTDFVDRFCLISVINYRNKKSTFGFRHAI